MEGREEFHEFLRDSSLQVFEPFSASPVCFRSRVRCYVELVAYVIPWLWGDRGEREKEERKRRRNCLERRQVRQGVSFGGREECKRTDFQYDIFHKIILKR